MSPTRLRIAISGFAGTGKTSLTHALSKKFAIPIIQEDMTSLANAQRDFIIAHSRNEQNKLESLRDKTIGTFLSWEKQRGLQYQRHDSFVADRWEADLLEMWLVRFGPVSGGVDSISSQLLRTFQERAKMLDLVIVTPLLLPFTSEKNEQGIIRNVSLTAHVMNMAFIMGLMQNFAEVPLMNLPNKALSVDERVGLITEELLRRKLI